MGFFQELAGRVEELAAAGARFADVLVRTAGYAVSGTLVFVDREITYAQQARKKRSAESPEGRKSDGRK